MHKERRGFVELGTSSPQLGVLGGNLHNCKDCRQELTEDIDAALLLEDSGESRGFYEIRTSPIGLCLECYHRRHEAKLRANMGLLLREARVPKRFQDANKATIPPVAWQKVSAWIGSREALFIYGPVGTGKSFLAAAVARELLLQEQRLLWWSAIGLLDTMRGDLDRADEVLTAAQRIPVLVLDDLGAERGTDFAAERLSALISRRWDSELPAIITSNLTPDVLAEANARLASRVCSGTLVGLGGRDLRISISPK